MYLEKTHHNVVSLYLDILQALFHTTDFNALIVSDTPSANNIFIKILDKCKHGTSEIQNSWNADGLNHAGRCCSECNPEYWLCWNYSLKLCSCFGEKIPIYVEKTAYGAHRIHVVNFISKIMLHWVLLQNFWYFALAGSLPALSDLKL